MSINLEIFNLKNERKHFFLEFKVRHKQCTQQGFPNTSLIDCGYLRR